MQDQRVLVASLRLLDSGGLLQEVVTTRLLAKGRLVGEVSDLNFVLSVILQYTDQLNFSILTFYADHRDTLDPLWSIDQPGLRSAALHTVFRLFDAQPFLQTLWDCSPLFRVDCEQLGQTEMAICQYLRALVHAKKDTPSTEWAGQELVERLRTIKELDDGLRLCKAEQRRYREAISSQLGELDL